MRPATLAKNESSPESYPVEVKPVSGENPMPAWKRWALRILMIVFIPSLLVWGLEAGLRFAGYGYDTSFFIEREKGNILTNNERFAWQFYSPKSNLKPHPFRIPTNKPPGAFRVFVLGESAALGTPDPAFGFARILERMLAMTRQKARVEVVNAAMPGINSHIILPIARECARQSPDLFILYMGNNEIVGLHAPDPSSSGWPLNLSLLRLVQSVKSSRAGQLLAETAGERDSNTSKEQDMAFFRNHRLSLNNPGRQFVYSNFRENLSDVLEITTGMGAKVLLMTVAVNLHDCPPLGSLHRSGFSEEEQVTWNQLYQLGIDAESRQEFQTALQHYQQAMAMDGTYAELHFRMARCHEGLRMMENASESYRLARDHDTLPFRADSQINKIIHEMADRFRDRDVVLIDTETVLGRREPAIPAIPGAELFYEHVHFRFNGDYEIAKNIFPHAIKILDGQFGDSSVGNPSIPSRDACAGALAYTILKEAQMNANMTDLTGQPPFQDQLDHTRRFQQAKQEIATRYGGMGDADLRDAQTVFRRALATWPDDWNLYFQLGKMHLKLRNFSAAAASLKQAKKLLPHYTEIRMGIGRALLEMGRHDEAIAELEEVLRMDPSKDSAKSALEMVMAGKAAARR